MSANADQPTVSVVVPCRNERSHIRKCLDSVVGSDFPAHRLEVLVADGMSSDGTREVLADYSRLHPMVRVLDNPTGTTPDAMNTGVTHARGELIMIMSAHATIASDAIRKCVEYVRTYDADNVGGMWRIEPRGNTLWDRAVAAVLSHPWGVGGARYRTHPPKEPVWVDTAAYGCYRREVFQRIGLFNPRLVRGQDMDLNLRLKRAGGRTLLAPDVVITYYARSGFLDFARHNFGNGVWAILPFRYAQGIPVGLRHLVPLGFVGGLIALGIAGKAWPMAWSVLGLLGAVYLLACLFAAAQVAARERTPRFLFALPLAFITLHVPYGLGSLWGVCQVTAAALVSGLRRRLRPHPPGPRPAPGPRSGSDPR